MDWSAIQEGYKLVEKEVLKRADGDNFSIYKAGAIIRIDIKQEGG